MNEDKDLDEYQIASILKAYLIDGWSHRTIQSEILGLPAPSRGGGFVAMTILHNHGVKGEHKALFKNSFKNSALPHSTILLLKNLIDTIDEAHQYFEEKQINPNLRPTERFSQVKSRVYQNELRKLILKNYKNKCALCTIKQEDLLVASHIKPWSIDEANRLNPQNVINFCLLHDRLFERGYFGINENYDIVINNSKCDDNLKKMLEGLKFKLPIKDHPKIEFLKYHMLETVKLK